MKIAQLPLLFGSEIRHQAVALEKAATANKAAMEKEIAEIETWEKEELSKLEKMFVTAQRAARVVGRWTAQQVQAAIEWFQWGGVKEPLPAFIENPGGFYAYGMQKSRAPANTPEIAEGWRNSSIVLRDTAMEERQRRGIAEPASPWRKRKKEKGRGGR